MPRFQLAVSPLGSSGGGGGTANPNGELKIQSGRFKNQWKLINYEIPRIQVPGQGRSNNRHRAGCLLHNTKTLTTATCMKTSVLTCEHFQHRNSQRHPY